MLTTDLSELVSRIADQYGILPRHILTDSDAMKALGREKLSFLTPSVIGRAELIFQAALEKTREKIARFNGVKPKKTRPRLQNQSGFIPRGEKGQSTVKRIRPTLDDLDVDKPRRVRPSFDDSIPVKIRSSRPSFDD